MTNASDFKKSRRKIIFLPTGGEIVIRRLTELDYATVIGDLPSIFSGKTEEAAEELETKIKNDPVKFWKDNRKMVVLVLCRGVVSPKFVDKAPAECGDEEISIDDITIEEFNFILNEINSLRVITSEDASNLKPFFREPASNRSDSSSGNEVRDTADRTSRS